MLTFIAKLLGPDGMERIRQEALASRKKAPAAMGEDKTEEEKKKEDEDDEHMEQDAAPVDSQNKDATGGEDKGGGSGTTYGLITSRCPPKHVHFTSLPGMRMQ